MKVTQSWKRGGPDVRWTIESVRHPAPGSGCSDGAGVNVNAGPAPDVFLTFQEVWVLGFYAGGSQLKAWAFCLLVIR